MCNYSQDILLNLCLWHTRTHVHARAHADTHL